MDDTEEQELGKKNYKREKIKLGCPIGMKRTRNT